MEKIRVLLIEDNRLLREGIASMLDQQGEFEVIAAAGNGNNLNDLIDQHEQPQVVLIDLGLQKESSLQLMGWIGNEIPEAKFIAMDILPDQDDIFEFIQAGGAGFILKDATIDDVITTIKKVASGEKVLPSVLTSSLFSQIVKNAINLGTINIQESIRLTKREQEIIDLISEGLSNKEIAQRLHIAVYTVKSHVHNILEKLALRTRLQVAAFAHMQRSSKSLPQQ